MLPIVTGLPGQRQQTPRTKNHLMALIGRRMAKVHFDTAAKADDGYGFPKAGDTIDMR